MSDLQTQKQRQTVQDLIQRERVAENFEKHNVTVQDTDMMSVRQTESDQSLIGEYLSGKYGEINEEERIRLQNTMDRNMSHILVNKRKTGGDSPEMTLVKDAIEELEQMLARDFDLDQKPKYAKAKNEVLKKYQDAIDACNNYLEKRPGWRFWPSGRKRKKAVQERLNRLVEEKVAFERGLNMQHAFSDEYKVESFKDALDVGMSKVNEINQNMSEYREHTETMMNHADDVYNMLTADEELMRDMGMQKTEKPWLSEDAQTGYDRIFKHNDVSPSFTDLARVNQNYIQINENAKWVTNDAYLMEFEKVNQMLHDHSAEYEQNRVIVDSLVQIFFKDLLACDALVTVSMQNDAINRLQDVKAKRTQAMDELSALSNYYMQKNQIVELHSTMINNLLKGILAGKKVDESNLKALSNDPGLQTGVRELVEAKGDFTA